MWEIEFAARDIGAADDMLRQSAAPGQIPMSATQGGRLGYTASGDQDEVLRMRGLLEMRGQESYLTSR